MKNEHIACAKCKKCLPETEFSVLKNGRRIKRCRRCQDIYLKWTAKNREIGRRHNKARRDDGRQREWRLNTQYKISSEYYGELFKKQHGCCAICRSSDPGGKHKVFVVDHNHETGEVRGLLCGACNRGIGYLKDDKNVLVQAVQYLSSPPARELDLPKLRGADGKRKSAVMLFPLELIPATQKRTRAA